MAYVGSAFIATDEARAQPEYKQMVVDSCASDIVYSNFFSGVHGNYLAPSIARAGLDPGNLPDADPSKMSFGQGGGSERPKAWRDVWGCGQGVGVVEEVVPAGALVARLQREYDAARAALAPRSQSSSQPELRA